MVTIEEARQALAQRRKQVQTTQLRPATRAELGRRTRQELVLRQQQERALQQVKSGELKELQTYEQQIKQAEQKYEQEKREYQQKLQSQQQAQRKAEQEVTEWNQAYDMAAKGKRYDPKSSVGRKIDKIHKQREMASLAYTKAKNEAIRVSGEQVYVGGLGYSVAPHLQEPFIKSLPQPKYDVAYKSSLTGETISAVKAPNILWTPIPVSKKGEQIGEFRQIGTRVEVPVRKPTILSQYFNLLAGEKGKKYVGLFPGFGGFKKEKLGTISGKEVTIPLAKPLITFSTIKEKIQTKPFGGGFGDKVVSQFIPETPLEVGITAGTIGLAGGWLGKPIARVTQTAIFGLSTKQALDPEKKPEERVAAGLVAGGLLAGTSSFFFKKITTKTPTRALREPTFVERALTIVKEDKPIRVSEFTIFGEKRPPYIRETTTRFRQILGLRPKQRVEVPARTFKVKTLEPAIGELPFEVGVRTGKVKGIDIYRVSGTNIPRNLQQFRQLPRVEQFVWQRMASDITGRPVALQNVPMVLLRNRVMVRNYIESQKLFSFRRPRRTRFEIKTPELGKTIRRAEALSDVRVIKETDKLKVSGVETRFKDVTLPFARAAGKTTELKGFVLEMKEPILLDKGTGVKFLRPSEGKKTPLTKTFQEQITKQLSVEKVVSTIPKSTRIRQPSTKLTPTQEKINLLKGIPRAAGGMGLTETQIKMGQGRVPLMEEFEFIAMPSSLVSDSRIDTRSALDIKAKPEVALFQQPQLKTLQEEVLISKSIESLSPKSQQLLKTGLATKVSPRLFPRLKQDVSLSQKIVQDIKTGTRTPPSLDIIRVPPPPPIPIILSPSETLTEEKLSTLKSKGQSVDVHTGMQIGKKRVIYKRQHPFTGLKKGLDYIDRNIEASVRLVPNKAKPTGRPTRKFSPGIKFRPSKRNPLYIVEKRKFRLDMPGEKRQIKSAPKKKRRKRRK